jgi:hypothetical protein
MKFGLLILEQEARFPEIPFFGYNRLKELMKQGDVRTSEEFLGLLRAELEMLDEAHEKTIESSEEDSFHYKWSQLNAVAVAKITKKWNRHNSVGGTVSYSQIAEMLCKTKFYRVTYVWTAPSEKIECPICLEAVTNPVMYSEACDHRFCATCAVAAACRKESEGKCPLCRQGGFDSLALEPVKEQGMQRADDWPRASTLLSSLKKLEPLGDTSEGDPTIDEKYLQKVRQETSPSDDDGAAPLSVMTFNLLAPVWASPKLYPSVEQRYLDPEAPRPARADPPGRRRHHLPPGVPGDGTRVAPLFRGRGPGQDLRRGVLPVPPDLLGALAHGGYQLRAAAQRGVRLDEEADGPIRADCSFDMVEDQVKKYHQIVRNNRSAT